MSTQTVWYQSSSTSFAPTAPIRLRPRWITRSLTGKRRRTEKIEADLIALRSLAFGDSYTQIANALREDESTSRARIAQMKKRAGAKSTPHLILVACRAGLLEVKP